MASSRLNGADVSEDLTQVNGAAAMPPPVAANTARTAQQRGFPATLSLGAPRHRPGTDGYTTKGNVEVSCKVMDVPHAEECVEDLVHALDSRRGVLLTSSYEFPGRYARWTLGFSDPPLELSGTGRDFRVRALNDSARCLSPFSQEERSKQPSLFSVVRAAVDLFYYEGDPQLGLYGAFGYDLTFQFDSIPLKHERDGSQKDLLLYLPDKMLVVDQDKRDAWSIEYDFAYGGATTEGLPREGEVVAYKPSDKPGDRDTPPGDYAKKVDKAKQEFKVGNLFEVVLSQTFKKPCTSSPAKVFRRLRKRNPSPYGFLINLGDQEYLVGASPEMFVRCERTRHGIRVETCPISGTIERGANPLEDAQKIRSLLSNKKEESELTMCTDVDRNDKSRICEPSSVRVLGRRQIEMYSRLIHTVDHVEGYLRKGFDALDAFLCHTWAVTVTGAPKTWAIRFVEQNEASPRAWYGGAVGLVGFDGHLNTGLTLRTVRVKDGIAEVRAGATLLFDSEPALEEAETELKASAMIDAVTRGDPQPGATGSEEAFKTSISTGVGKSVLLVDHEDSFVHTLGNYLRQTGAEVSTVRSGDPLVAYLRGVRKGKQPYPDLVVLSPGPGNPSDFGLSGTIREMLDLKVPAFGVCLGLQGIVEHFGGELAVLDYPMHGKPSTVSLVDRDSHSRAIFEGVPDSFEVARYHSLYGAREEMPDVLRPTAETADGVIMAIEHKELPFAAVQFHPESILTDPRTGLTILANCFRHLRYDDAKNEQ
ncbi:Anthranilate Synthase [Ectocarpus siliculosus]|uniref:p-aminobenzoic acid synthase n=1 Tax=Ectocarpus siliculosus TaxID=2880 RepID=D7FYK6_ECTSI|nr:Anthranilate Synthase [Ectocarpus siliculosus]|eukprot:CBJ32548.1 Anthranilate Synthase [Ectocarpus siliculosus]